MMQAYKNIKNKSETKNVTELNLYRTPMKNPILVELLEHWENLRGGRIAPSRSEIDPRQIENALQHAFIIEPVADGEARFRIAGMGLCDLMGMEVRAMPASSIILPENREQFSATLNGLFSAPEIIELTLETVAPGHRTLKADMLLLPMMNDLGAITRILGCLVANGAATSPPHRFAITSRKVTRIIASDHQPQRSRPKRQRVDGFAEAQHRFTPRPSRPKGASHLTLVVSDE
jgi:hypothetical protein